MPSDGGFKYDLAGSPPQVTAQGGTIREANQTTFPALNGLAVYLLTLAPGAVRIPHWHPDASELDYVLTGTAQIGIADPSGAWQRFEAGAGEIAFIPQGWFHYISNPGQDELRMLVIFNNANPNDIGISEGFQPLPDEVLALTFGVPAETFKDFDRQIPWIAPA